MGVTPRNFTTFFYPTDVRRQMVDYYVDGHSGYVVHLRYVGSSIAIHDNNDEHDNNNEYKELIVEGILSVYETHQDKPIYKDEIVRPAYKKDIKTDYEG